MRNSQPTKVRIYLSCGAWWGAISYFEQCDNTQVNNVMCNLYNLGFWMIRSLTTTFAALFPWGPNRILAISSPTKIINIVQSIMVLRCFGDPLCEEHRKSCGIQLPCQKKGFTVHLPIFCKTLNNLFCFPGLCLEVLCIAGVVLGALGDQGTSWALKHYYI